MLQSILDIFYGTAPDETDRQHFENNLTARLTVDIEDNTTLLQFDPITGSWPSMLDAGKWFYATLSHANGEFEIVKVTAATSSTLTVIRGQENTTALNWNKAATILSARVTAATLQQGARKNELNTWTLAQQFLSGFFARGDGRFETGLSIGTEEEPIAELVHESGKTILRSTPDFEIEAPNIVIGGLNWPVGAGSATQVLLAEFEPDGVETVFELRRASDDSLLNVTASENLYVYIDGLRQQPEVDYTVDSTEITFTSPPSGSDVVWATYLEPSSGNVDLGTA